MPIDFVIQDDGGGWTPVELSVDDPTPKDGKITQGDLAADNGTIATAALRQIIQMESKHLPRQGITAYFLPQGTLDQNVKLKEALEDSKLDNREKAKLVQAQKQRLEATYQSLLGQLGGVLPSLVQHPIKVALKDASGKTTQITIQEEDPTPRNHITEEDLKANNGRLAAAVRLKLDKNMTAIFNEEAQAFSKTPYELVEIVFEEMKAIFQNDQDFDAWKQFVVEKKITVGELFRYREIFSEAQSLLGADSFAELLHGTTSQASLAPVKTAKPKEEEQYFDGTLVENSSPHFYGVAVTGVSPQRLRYAIWDHGDSYGAGKIGAERVYGSELYSLKGFDPNKKDNALPGPDEKHVLLQFVIKNPEFYVHNQMALLDVYLEEAGWTGFEVYWRGRNEPQRPWYCGWKKGDAGTSVYPNSGGWKILTLAEDKTMVIYHTHSQVSGDVVAEYFSEESFWGALKNNMTAFIKGAIGKYGDP